MKNVCSCAHSRVNLLCVTYCVGRTAHRGICREPSGLHICPCWKNGQTRFRFENLHTIITIYAKWQQQHHQHHHHHHDKAHEKKIPFPFLNGSLAFSTIKLVWLQWAMSEGEGMRSFCRRSFSLWTVHIDFGVWTIHKIINILWAVRAHRTHNSCAEWAPHSTCANHTLHTGK